MIRQRLGERQRLPNKPAAALAERVVESFKQARLPGCLTTRLVARGGKDRGIRTPEIGVTDGTLAVHGWERLPQTTPTAFVARRQSSRQSGALRHQGRARPTACSPSCQQTTTVRHIGWSAAVFLIGTST